MQNDARRAGFELGPGQLVVLSRLVRLARELEGSAGAPASASAPAPEAGEQETATGVYVWGRVGRGKTWLLDAFVRALPEGTARRVHSHTFFDELHRRMHEYRVASEGDRARLEREAFDHAVDGFVGGAPLLVFDELEIGDPGDATLMTRLLEHLGERGVAFLVSSNSAPQDLLPDPVWHRVFEPGIRLILERMDVAELAGPVDYRALAHPGSEHGSGFRSGAWLTSSQLSNEGLRAPSPDERTELSVGGRRFAVEAARPGELWVSFAELCEHPLSTMEYIDWSRRFGERWVVTAVPTFSRASRSGRLRFLAAIDVLADADIPTYLVTEADPAAFLAEVRSLPAAARLASRLTLLRRRPQAGEAGDRQGHFAT
ncbi:cell division protein ZapE [Herbiconiux sp. CPCC 203407]|uniref:Cell division protein ZapE n=1 Tax=Herbiconiux oxytropis TaxID=2970915 RepID=A0AA42BSF5_9MICO|nr:cell division protein ZapE [Herbiconiux oxytropis]MCS5721110.1 cell division protein ZapE [Herbiconiux oxytropis]MCS5724762.1 cell division protein ZapE [Herbiconiux oxytropis]